MKLVVIACNTATAIGEDVVREVAAEHGVEVVPVVAPQAEIAAAITDNGRVGVLATTNTVESGAYRRALEAQGRALDVIEVAAPRLAPFIQEGSLFDEETMEMARGYCAPLREAGVDTLILGCTHYPLVAPMLQRILGRNVRLVSGGHAVAAAVQRTLERAGLAREGDEEGTYEFFCTGPVSSFGEVATRFLQMPLGEVRQVEFSVPSRAVHCSSGTEIFHSARHPRAFPCQGPPMPPPASRKYRLYLWRDGQGAQINPRRSARRIDELASRAGETRERVPPAHRRARDRRGNARCARKSKTCSGHRSSGRRTPAELDPRRSRPPRRQARRHRPR